MRLVHMEEVRPGVWIEAYLTSNGTDWTWALRSFAYGPRRREVPAVVAVRELHTVHTTAQRLERERQADELRQRERVGDE